MKKVLVISSYPAPYRVGVFAGLAKEYDLDVFFDTCKNENRNATWFCKSGELKFDVLDNDEAKKRFSKALSEIKKYDFVIAYDPARKPAIKAIILCRILGVPYYVNNDGAIIRPNFINDRIKRFLFKGARACFASGDSSVKYFKYYGVKEERIHIHCFSSLYESDILSSLPKDDDKKSLKETLGLDVNLPAVISIGQFIPRKGFDVLLKAWKGIGDKAQLLIIGGGDDRPIYESMIGDLGLKNVKIIDFMPKDQLFKYYLASDLFVLPTREDVWGLVINEAMAMGLPVITTDNCNAGLELVVNGENGYIVPVEDVDALHNSLDGLLSDLELCRKMSENNLKKIRAYTIENIARSHIETIGLTL